MQLSFTYSPVWILLIVLLAALVSWFMYRGTRESLPSTVAILLGGFRFTVLTVLGILLLEPLLTQLKKITSPPIVAVLQDVSESVAINRDSAFVKQEFPTLLSSFLNDFDSETYSLDTYSYSSEVTNGVNPDSLAFNQSGTRISAALDFVQQRYQNQNLGAVVLLTDGISTSGSSPLYAAEKFRQPIYTVLLGDTTPQRDLKIREVLFNEIAYLNNESPIRVKVQNDGFERSVVKVSLLKGSKVMKTETVTLTRTKSQEEVLFTLKPEEVGLQAFDIRISREDNEITYRNNQRRIYLNVLETRVKIALFAGSPHPDLGAFEEAFRREDRYQLTQFILKERGIFYTDPTSFNLKDFDLLILHNFPQSSSDKGWVDKIVREANGRKVPLMFFVGGFSDLKTMRPLYPLMALSPGNINPRSEEVIANFLPAYKQHSSYTFGDRWLNWINAAPPVVRNRSNWEPKTTSEVFATAKIKNIALDYPVFALQNTLGRKNSVFLGEGVWRLRAHSFLETESFDAFDDWLFNLIKWLMVSDDKRKFKVQPSKRLFTGGEPVSFKGQVYDDSYNPISGVDIKLIVTNPEGQETDYYLNETGAGQYFLELGTFEEGTYRYRATGKRNEVQVGKDNGQFSVGQSNIEHARLQADQNLLRQLALRTGGTFVTGRELSKLAGNIQAAPGLKPTVDYQTARRPIFDITALLIGLLLLLSVEWIVRKWHSLL
ncbi:MAG: hypothetical protein AAGI38_01650 [Bacteroidota bacterium]